MDVGALSDADLARSIGSAAPGEASAAEGELYARLAPQVRLYGLRHLRDAQAAADLVQQVLLMTIEHLRKGKIREPERLPSYVLGMCRMVVLDIRRGGLRRERALRRFADDLPSVESTPVRASQPRDWSEIVLLERMDRVRALPACVKRVKLIGHEAGGERLLGEYTFVHTPSAHP